jgi:hypothetical protein
VHRGAERIEMKNQLYFAGLIAGVMAWGTSLQAVDAPGSATTETKEHRMAWWREAKFGMFIHWGLYAVPAGSWQGKPVSGTGEWIMHNGKIPVVDYKALASPFDPIRPSRLAPFISPSRLT